MRLFELFGYWNSLRTFFFTFKTLDALVSTFVFREVTITGDNSPQFHAASSLILHAIKHLAEIPDKIKLLPPNIVDSVLNLKTYVLNEKTLSLDLMETLIPLSISATVNPAAQLAMEKLEELHWCEVHMTHIPTPGDEAGLRRLGVNLTSDPNFSTKDLVIL